MIDVGTFGSTPSQVVLNDLLIKLNNKRVTNIICSRFLKASDDLKRLKKLVLPNDIQFYDRLLALLRTKHMENVKESPTIPKDVYTHWRCVMTGLFRQAKSEIKEQVKENIRRTQRGQQPL